MKLKKFAALVLAGVMAVSMLAGCGSDQKNDGPDQNGTTGTTTAGYSAAFADVADVDLDYVTFQDSAADQAALKEAIKYCSDVQLYAALVGGNTYPGYRFPSAGVLSGIMPITKNLTAGPTWYFLDDMVDVFADKADLEYVGAKNLENEKPSILKDEVQFEFDEKADMLSTVKKGTLFAADGTMSPETVLLQINKVIKDLSATLDVSGTADGITVDYHYTVSVSIVSRTTTMSDVVKADMDFVAVTITRTGTLAA